MARTIVGRVTPADAATMTGGFLAALSIPLSIAGFLDTAVRLLFASYALDVLDGWLARRYGSAEDGFFLDRAFDRLGQVVAPGVLLLAWSPKGTLEYELYSLYFALLVVVAYYRLVRRGVRSLTHFNGLPLFAHAGIILAGYIAGTPPHPAILVALLIASAVPIPYYRRSRGHASPSPATLPRLVLVASLALLPYDNPLVEGAARMVVAAIVAYAALGPLLALALAPGEAQ